MQKEEQRFSIIDEEICRFHRNGTPTIIRIIHDSLSGINYLMTYNNCAGGLTPLLDSDGKVSRS